jgi:hypothetical protein
MARPERDVRILAAVAQLLRHLGVEETAFKVKVEWAEGKHLIACGPEWPAEPNASRPPQGKWLSPLEQRIVDYLRDREGWTRTEAVAEALEEPHQHRFKAIVANLAERLVIEALSGQGIRLTPPSGATSGARQGNAGVAGGH